jgi:hypothetical protein
MVRIADSKPSAVRRRACLCRGHRTPVPGDGPMHQSTRRGRPHRTVLASAVRRRYLPFMTRVQEVEREVAALSNAELAEFRRWYAEFDAAVWDTRIADDVAAGALDRFATEALEEHRAGRTRSL